MLTGGPIATFPSPNDAISRFLLIGNPASRRVNLFQDALQRAGLAPARVLAYEELLRGQRRLESELVPRTIVRIESPGQDFAVEKLLLARGAAAAEAEGAPSISQPLIERLEFDRGLILYPRQWYLGFRAFLDDCDALLGAVPGVRVLNAPREVAAMFEKRHCHDLFAASGVPIPESLGAVNSFDELIFRMDKAGVNRAFVKLATGSSASGVVAFQRRCERFEAVTTCELVRTGGGLRLYNSRRILRYSSLDDIRALIEALAREGVQVERWLPKASLQGRPVDLRVVVIAGEARHTVVRQGSSPMTNLHLGSKRVPLCDLSPRWNDGQSAALSDLCRRAAGLFPHCLYAGLDVLLTPGFRQFVLEINAFGDLLPGILADGVDTYSAEIAAALDEDRP